MSTNDGTFAKETGGNLATIAGIVSAGKGLVTETSAASILSALSGGPFAKESGGNLATLAGTVSGSKVVANAKATVQPLYGTSNQAITCTITSLASSATAARQSTVVDNSSNLYGDVHVFVKVKTNASGTSATGYVNVYGYATADGGTTYIDGVTGSDGAFTLSTSPNLPLLGTISTIANATIYSACFSFCAPYGLLYLPQKWGIVVANVSGATLDASVGSAWFQGVNTALV